MSNGPSFTLVDECDMALEPDRFYGNAPLPAMRRLNFVGQGYMAPTVGFNVPYFPFRAIPAALADVRHAHARAQGVPDGKIDPHRDRKPGTRLQVHHLTYVRIGEEHFEDLLVLCNDCHRLQHRRRFWAVIDGNAKTRGKRLGSGRIATDQPLMSRSHAKYARDR